MKIQQDSIGVIIYSENYQKLAEWYEKVLNFEVKSRQNIPGDVYVAFEFGQNYFSIAEHSQVKGTSKDKYRIMLGFNVESVTNIYEELKHKKVKFIAIPFESPESGYFVVTIEDPDGNILQFFGGK